ncbi:MAG: polysaccharide biosynthesis protein [Lachnospiraceae bacterium]|nr:polysaccharide biosynthesis protein [Lachnospiraceae bacterium]
MGEQKNSSKKTSKPAFSNVAVLLVALDIITIAISYYVGLWARFDFSFAHISREYITHTSRYIAVVIVYSIIIYFIAKLYHSIWRYASINEALRVIYSYVVIAILNLCINMIPDLRIPRGVILIGFILSMFFCVVIRFSYRMLRYVRHKRDNAPVNNIVENIMIIGAGQATREILKDITFSKRTDLNVCVIIDDNEKMWGHYLEGIKIAGGREAIPTLVEKYDIHRIIFSIPSALPHEKREILNICKDTGVHIQTVPGMFQIIDGEVNLSSLKDVDVTDLLGRSEIKINMTEVMETISGKVIMVTGGGGSIGSELCRQIAHARPKQLIIFDVYENNAYAIQQELVREYGNTLDLITLIGSVRNTNRVNYILKTYKPDMVFHAAAHKHVPLMEDSPNEAIKNNVMGTYKMAHAAWKNGVKRFLLISTDKAVNPTNIMGASKRLCEMVVQMMSRQHPETIFMAVRFGNVLGSNGSVIPLFKKQIAKGGPVTVTDKNIIRYFMTIPEAVSLVLQASYYAKGGEIFVLDMGKPVRIDDLARNLIMLSGFTPDEDIQIVYTGLRPGEKLFEELLMDEEGMKKTDNNLIYIGHPIEMDDNLFRKQLELLNEESKQESNNIKKIVSEIVPTYTPAAD